METIGLGAKSSSKTGAYVSQAIGAAPSEWNQEADVVVLGYGGGGAITAIEAADAGADVVILEKNPADRHICNTNVSGGIFISPMDVEKAFQYIRACIGDTVDDTMCRLWAQHTSTNKDYLKKLADSVGETSDIVRFGGAEFPDLPGADGISSWIVKPGGGAKMFEIMDKCVRARKNIRIAYDSPGKKLIRGSGGEILGVVAECDGKEINIRGRRATILASGGFEFNEQIKLNAFFGNPRYFYGTDSNTGDGLLMAMAAGADLWHMNWSSQHYGFFYNNVPVGMGLGPITKPSYMVVDQYGKRYFNENYNGHSSYAYAIFFDPLKGVYPRIPSYLVFDEQVRTMGAPLSPNAGPAGGVVGAKTAKYGYFWSTDQSKEIENGWIMKADTIEELAQMIRARQGPNKFVHYASTIKMDPTVLANSVAIFNENAQQRKDPEFGRHVLAPIERGPFYATEVWPCGPNTQGGPRFDPQGRVLDVRGNPIPRLYKAGELGSIYGQRYPAGGGNLAEILAFGRIAGQNAAKELA
jgi:succinate dehydrogenase/fumarate reductase flavoprotein subunit